MATVSGACVIAKVSGLLQIREDTTPSKLMWKAIDQDKSLEVPLNNLSKLQASPDSSPKLLLRLFYLLPGSADVKDIKLTFNNRQTMNAVKEALQTIVARQKTVIKDTPAPTESGVSNSGTPTPAADSQGAGKSSGDPLDFSTPQSLSDASLLKNRPLQQKLLLEDKTLRNIFRNAVIEFKLSPTIFWSTRVSQLRTYALSICQHRGPYNVLSTIKPVATSDNQVNVNVTRDTINEIFETYPIIRRACSELVPEKLNEGEFWSRFFNSKLFRRLRGDKINSSNTRGDIVIDKYLYVDADFVENEDNNRSEPNARDPENQKVSKFIDLLGNEVDNSQKLGISPDFTMKFTNESSDKDAGVGARPEGTSNKHENEMLILMKNMNKLSSKMVGSTKTSGDQSVSVSADKQMDEREKELTLGDLNDADEVQYIELSLDTHAGKNISMFDPQSTKKVAEDCSEEDLNSFLYSSVFVGTEGGIDLSEAYETKGDEIGRASQMITALVKHNFRSFKSLHQPKDSNGADSTPLLSEQEVQELITFNITIIEFLSHFWNLFANGENPVQLKKLFTVLRNSQASLTELEKRIRASISENEHVKQNEKLKEKLLKDLSTCIFPLTSGLNKAVSEYVAAIRAAAAQEQQAEVNENGKRPLES